MFLQASFMSDVALPRLSRGGRRVDEHGVRPPRPALSPLLLPAVLLWLAICLGAEIRWEQFVGDAPLIDALSSIPPPLLATAAAAVATAAAAALVRFAAARFAVASSIAALAIGLAIGLVCWGSLNTSIESIGEGGASGDFRIRVTSDASSTTLGWYSQADASSTAGATARVRVMWDDEEDIRPYGYELAATASITPLSAKESSRWSYNSLIVGRLRISSAGEEGWAASVSGALGMVRQRCADMIGAYEGDGPALLAGIVLGYTTPMDGTSMENDFKVTGLAHLVAVSGGHMTVVIMLVTMALRSLGVPRKPTTALVCLLMGAYLVLTAMQPSALRSCAMALLGSVSWMAKRKASSQDALVAAFVAMLAADPSNAFSVGFGLSVLGVFSLVIFLPLAMRWVRVLLPKRAARAAGGLVAPLSMTLTAQAATTPLSASMFSMLSLASPVCNLIAAPLISAALTLGLVSCLVGLVAQPVGMLFIGISCSLCNLIADLAAWMAGIPHVCVPVHAELAPSMAAGFAAAAALWVAWPLPSPAAARKVVAVSASAAIALALAIGRQDGTRIVAMDVGQGDAILVCSGGSRVLVDTGQYGSDLLDALGRQHVASLDAVVLTHFDSDHCGALSALDGTVKVGSVVVAAGSLSIDGAQLDGTASQAIEGAESLVGRDNLVEVAAGSSIELSEELSMTVAWPVQAVEESGNDESLCFVVSYRGSPAALLTGDAESEPLEAMLDAGLGEVPVLKVGHHGSADSVSAEALERLAPSVAIISVGEGNRYGHPSEQTLGLLEDAGVVVYRTDIDGDVSVVLEEGRATVGCAKI